MAETAGERLGAKLRAFASSLEPDERQALADLGSFAELGSSLKGVLSTMHAALQAHVSVNAQLLQLLDATQTESRKFATLSNVLKARRDEVGAIVENIK
jgi:hypothetical protein